MPTHTGKNEEIVTKGASFVQSEEASLESPIQTDSVGDAYAAELAFLNETVEVQVLPSYNPEDTTRLVEIAINGKSYYFIRGEWTKCPRFVLEKLATTKKQAWSFGSRRTPDGVTVQTSDSNHILRYPHHYRDTNPKGAAWYDSLKDRTF
jgi:hypothetical protein